VHELLNCYGMLMFTELNPFATLLPTVCIATMHKTAMSSANNPYSMSAAPASSSKNLRTEEPKRFMNYASRRTGGIRAVDTLSKTADLSDSVLGLEAKERTSSH